ncbi:phosphatidylserine decarboxylase [Bacillus sp. Marseille-P3661]|uniref:phosphatidylserine decarboxylase n=1 Tax=Bacillus sp. Marseille-P3661 TaxID=1936234 RepID=UPI000C85FA9C|nr:phosphatidylserine decarboxylase [Bacillus sp. Marseille-P3661]
MVKYIYQSFVQLTNNLYLSKLLRRFTLSKKSKYLIPGYAKAFQVNQAEMENDLNQYSSLHEFFIRTLKKDARAIDESPASIISPVDGFIEDIGVIKNDKTIKVKGQLYSILDMLGDPNVFEKYSQGTYIILYLSPSDYHRIHSPISGKVVSQWTLGRHSYPVNKWGLLYGKDTLSRNYRMITEIQYETGYVAVVKVGAMFINSIELTHKGDELRKGEEMAYFSFGSTVVLLFEKESFKPVGQLIQSKVKVGQALGYVNSING